jgi:hypothetical protein
VRKFENSAVIGRRGPARVESFAVGLEWPKTPNQTTGALP